MMSNQDKSDNIYSFSRLENFNSCKRNFYYTYVLKSEKKSNNYSFLGGIVHEILEELQQGNIDKNRALELFEDGLVECDLNGYEWLSENTKNKYANSVKHYIENYKPIECDKFFIEEKFKIKLEGKKITGFIDLYTITDNEIDIYDYKTSTKFGKDLYKKFRQMILYGIALEQRYGDKYKINTLNFDMLKYIKVESKRAKAGYVLRDRHEIDPLDFNTYSAAYETMEYTSDIVEETKKYVLDTINEIESLGTDIEDYPKGMNPEKDFFCQRLCSNCEICKQN